MNDPTVAVLA